MSTELSSFRFQESSDVRVVVLADEPWFVAADVCAALDLPNTTKALLRLDDDEKQVVDFSALNSIQGVTKQHLNDGQKINIINESGLYSLVLTSRKQEAKKFKKWITAEVLPAIRKTGRYESQHVPSFDPPSSLSRLDLIKLALQSETERLALEGQVKEMEPKVAGFDRLIEADGAISLQSAAKALQQRPNKFCDWLRAHGWIYRRAGGSSNMGYQDKIQSGYLRHKVVVVQREDGTDKTCEQVLITPKGMARLAILLSREDAA